MSAREWTECPKCIEEHKREVARREKLVSRRYGQELQATFLARVSELEAFRNQPHEMSLARYYEFYFDTSGKFTMRFNCLCEKCGFAFEHRSESQADFDS